MKNFLIIALLLGVPVACYVLFRDTGATKNLITAGPAGGEIAAAVASGQPVLLNFYADWCPPCRLVAPEVISLNTELTGKARVVRINIDQNPALAQQYKVRGVPTFIALAKGKEKDRKAGAIPRNTMKQMLGM